MNITVEDVKGWQDSEVTKEFLSRIKIHMDDADIQVHRCLEKNEKEEAALHNAGMTAFEEILNLPEIIIEDIKEEEK